MALHHRTMTGPGACAQIADSDVETLADLAIATDERAALALVAGARARGLGMEALCLELLAPAARRLGERWLEDRCSFLQVTLGVGRLQQALFRLAPSAPRSWPAGEDPARALLVPATGEQHTFGVQMVGEVFRKHGWLVTGGPRRGRAALCTALASRHFDVVGLSLASERLLESAAADIRAIRGAPQTPRPIVLVGGLLAERRPELVAGLDADDVVTDILDAPRQARRALARIGAGAPGRAESD